MRRKRTSSALLLLILIFFISFLSLTCASYNHSQLLKIPEVHAEEAMTLSALSILIKKEQHWTSALLNQSTRMDIYNFVKNNPGVHFRALSNSLELRIGVLQYHLGLLVNAGLLSTHRDGRYKRYFESEKFTEIEIKIISILRQRTAGKILATLFKRTQMRHKDLAADLNITSQALTWQMKRLVGADLIKRSVEGLNVRYSLNARVSAAIDQHGMLPDNARNRI